MSLRDEAQEGTKADHLTTTDGQDRSALQPKKSVQESLGERLKEVSKWSTESCTIFKVNVGLCESKPDAYKPKLISIGPYHKKDLKLLPMEDYKLRYLQRFLQRKPGVDVESCIREMDELKDEAHKSYADKVDLNKFSEMLLLDGCFVVEYIREVFQLVPDGEENIINTDWMVSLIDRDLLLLENQLPFFVLTKLHDMTKHPTDQSFIKMVKYNFCGSLPRVTPKLLSETYGNIKEIKHLLQVVHICGCPPTSPGRPYFLTFEFEGMLKAKDPNIWHDLMRSATELDEAGVNFSKVGDIHQMLGKDSNKDGTCLFDIKFDKKTMKLPCFEVVSGTETILRNLVAYEQHSSLYPKYFTDYVVFMDRLINSEKDVKLLRVKGIIRNRIGDDEEVAKMFNRLGEGVIPSTDFYYKEVCRRAYEHCEKPWNKRKANLKQNYFNGPWIGLSTGAAVLLLLLTTTQTVLAFISTLKGK